MGFPFQESPDTCVLTCRHMLDEHAPVLRITHDQDGIWQFLCGKSHETADARVLSLMELWRMAPSAGRVAGLPCGCTAERKHRLARWRQYRR